MSYNEWSFIEQTAFPLALENTTLPDPVMAARWSAILPTVASTLTFASAAFFKPSLPFNSRFFADRVEEVIEQAPTEIKFCFGITGIFSEYLMYSRITELFQNDPEFKSIINDNCDMWHFNPIQNYFQILTRKDRFSVTFWGKTLGFWSSPLGDWRNKSFSHSKTVHPSSDREKCQICIYLFLLSCWGW